MGKGTGKKQHVPWDGLLSLWGHPRVPSCSCRPDSRRRGAFTADTPRPGLRPHSCPQCPISSQAHGALPVPYSDLHLATLPPEHTAVSCACSLRRPQASHCGRWQAQDFQPILGVLLDGQLRDSSGSGDALEVLPAFCAESHVILVPSPSWQEVADPFPNQDFRTTL